MSAAAAVPRATLPSIGLGSAGLGLAPGAVAVPSLGATLPSLSAPALLQPSLALAPSASINAPAASAATPAAAPALSATENGLIRAPNVGAGLAALRAASYELHPQVAEIVAKIKAAHPELLISAENLFLVRDEATLRLLEIPEGAAGAARIVSDGRREVPIVILAAQRGVALDDFVEFGVHEAVHLMDDGILRVRHDEELKHFFAEGWTQKRAVAIANEILAGMDRPATAGKAYHKEITLADAFIAMHGSAALDELVRTGSIDGLRRAFGDRWELAERLISGDGGRPGTRARRLDALIALINAKSVGPDEERVLLDYVRR
jgi:hypothetical protein